MNKQKSSTMPTLIDCSTEAHSDTADLHNNYFTKQSKVDNAIHLLPHPTYMESCSIYNINISPQYIKDAISCVNSSPRLIKKCIYSPAVTLSQYFKKLLSNSFVPSSTGQCMPNFQEIGPFNTIQLYTYLSSQLSR